MPTVRTLIGNIKGPKGDTGATGATGPQGPGATIEVGTVSTTAYGNPVQITNSGTETDAVLDFVIPQGKPGEQTTKMSLLTLDTITTQTAEYPIPAVGDVGSTAWGKIVKFFNDIKTAVTGKVDTTSIVNNLTSTSTDKPLSAAQGKALNDALSNTNTKVNSAWLLSVPTNVIASGTALNNVTTPGTYSCPSASIATTLVNCPVAYAFVMIVEHGMSNAYVRQTIYGYASGRGTVPVYSRICVSGTWTDWYGAEITSGKNMNTFEFPGRYVCNSASIASSLTNCPTNAAFVLDVEFGMNGAYLVQTVHVYSQPTTIPIYKRVRVSNSWNNWVQVH